MFACSTGFKDFKDSLPSWSWKLLDCEYYLTLLKPSPLIGMSLVKPDCEHIQVNAVVTY